MFNLLKLTTSCCAVFLLAACQSETATQQTESSLFATPWNSGLDAAEPEFHIQKIDENTIVLRQSLRKTFEAPFLYLIFGEEKALLIDTGVGGGNLRGEIDTLVDEWLAAKGRDDIALIVMHSHAHNDHIGGDSEFEDRIDTEIVGHTPGDVADFFGLTREPFASALYDLGNRSVEILMTPGHHPSHLMVFDPTTQILFTGDTLYPGRLYFQCGKLEEFSATIDYVEDFAAENGVKWFLGGHIEAKLSPGEFFPQHRKFRKGEHLLELPASIVGEIQTALIEASSRLVVKEYNEFALVPHPVNPNGKQPPNWCLADE